MKARPRSIERKVAEHLTNTLSQFGISPFERIPVLGRTGPDLTVNESRLIIDVKSRIEVPKGCIFQDTVEHTRFVSVPLDKLLTLFYITPIEVNFHSVIVDNYYDHMDEWTKQKHPSGITALVLHRPKMPVGKSMFIISKSDLRRFENAIRNSFSAIQ